MANREIIVEVKGIGLVKNPYLREQDAERLGKESRCICCGNTFSMGMAELDRAKLDDKFKPVKEVELYKIVNAKDLHNGYALTVFKREEFPKDIETQSLLSQATFFGLQCFSVKVCPNCYSKNMSEEDCVEATCYIGKGSGKISGHMEDN